MALMSATLETCERALGTSEPCRTSRPTRLFFMLDAHGPQGVVDAQDPGALPAGTWDLEPRDRCVTPQF
jgi:hypothetical protein